MYLAHLLARHRAEILALRDFAHAQMTRSRGGLEGVMRTVMEGTGSIIADADKLVVTLEFTRDVGTLDVALTPRPGSRFAQFVALQRPSDYALFDRLPAAQPVMIGGHVELGPYHKGMSDMFQAQYGVTSGKSMVSIADLFRKAATGDFVLTFGLGPKAELMVMQLMGLSDTSAANEALSKMLDVIKRQRTVVGERMSVTNEVKAATVYDGVSLHSVEATLDFSEFPADQRPATEAVAPDARIRSLYAIFDDLGLNIVGQDSRALAERTIDAARKRAAHFVASPAARRLLAASRANKDSVAVMMNLTALLAPMTGHVPTDAGFVMASFGCVDGSAHVRLALPAATLNLIATTSIP